MTKTTIRRRKSPERAISNQRAKLVESLAVAEDRLRHWLDKADFADAVELEYFAHGMEGVMDLFQAVANDAGHLAEMIDPYVEDKV